MFFKKINKAINLFLSLLVIGIVAQGQTFTDITYGLSLENFANPGRGFYHATSNIRYDDLVKYRSDEGISLIFKTFKLDDFKSSKIDILFLKNMEDDFETLRKAGMKCIIRFSYTERSTPPYGDAPLEIVLGHIEQLEPILRNNSDVILAVQAGFIGAWGEWYYTDYFSESPGNITEENWNDRRTLVDSLLVALPQELMVQLRTPYYKYNILQFEEYTPVSTELAFSASPLARLAHHNDCFVSSANDVGTYHDTIHEKPYLAEDTKYTIIGGETCAQCAQSHCENAVAELKRFHWTYLNIDYHTGVIGDWKDEGCFDDILLKLGYRYRLISAEIQNQSKAKGEFNLSLKLINDGWANPMSNRKVEVVLVNQDDANEYYLSLDTDLRFWPLNDTIRLSLNSGIPDFVEDGNYKVYLNLPDPDDGLKSRVEYSIQLANTGVWDTATGYNSLLHTLEIDDANTTEEYIGCNFFKKKNQKLLNNIDIVVDGLSADWEDVPTLCSDHSQKAKTLKLSNNSDTLFFLVSGEELNSHSQFYIDADNNSQTGYNADIWGTNGSDYLIEDNTIFIHYGDDNGWSWIPSYTIDGVSNGQTVELRIAFNKFEGIPLQNSFKIAYINNPAHFNLASLLPPEDYDFAVYTRRNLFYPPESLTTQQYASNIIVSWTRDPSNSVRTIVERSENNMDNFSPVFSADNQSIYFLDKDLTVGNTYYYRAYSAEGYNFTNPAGTLNRTVWTDEKEFAFMKLDGEKFGWDPVPPVATGPFDQGTTSIWFFNNADSLFYSIKTMIDNLEDYQLLFSTNEEGTVNYKISNDSLFASDGDSWLYQLKLSSFQNGNFLESAVSLGDIEMETKDALRVSALVNSKDIWGNNEQFYYLKYPSVSVPNNFKISPSVSDPYHKVKIKWSLNPDFDGFIIERSVNDSLHFERIVDLPNNKAYYLDGSLDSANIYYYRMFSYYGIVRSNYTNINWMKPGWTNGVEDVQQSLESAYLFPNPAKNKSSISIETDKSRMANIQLFNLNHKRIKDIFRGTISGQKTIEFSTDNLSAGIYLVGITIDSKHIFKKLIIY